MLTGSATHVSSISPSTIALVCAQASQELIFFWFGVPCLFSIQGGLLHQCMLVGHASIIMYDTHHNCFAKDWALCNQSWRARIWHTMPGLPNRVALSPLFHVLQDNTRSILQASLSCNLMTTCLCNSSPAARFTCMNPYGCNIASINTSETFWWCLTCWTSWFGCSVHPINCCCWRITYIWPCWRNFVCITTTGQMYTPYFVQTLSRSVKAHWAEAQRTICHIAA